MKTEVLTRVPEWNCLQQKTISYLRTLEGVEIPQGLAARLHNYALKTVGSAGFKEAVKDWAPSVYTLDGDDTPSNRSYCVRWTNAEGGHIEVVGILTRNGWPFLDHGLAIGR